MSVHRLPVLVWEDHAGGFTACLVEDEDGVAAFADSSAGAVEQLKDYLASHYKDYPSARAPDFSQAKLQSFRVSVRPEYRVLEDGRERIYACEHAVELKLACVTGRQNSGALLCALPALGIRFRYHEPAALKDLVAHHVQQALQEKTPQELSRELPPRSVELAEIVLRVPRPARSQETPPASERLEAVAEPLGKGALARRFSRVFERDKELAELSGLLATERANILIVGEPGSGKTSLLAQAARSAEREAARGGASPPRFWLTSGPRLTAGMKYLGQWEARCEGVIEELGGFQGTLCVENLLDLARYGGAGPEDSVAAFLLSYLQHGELRMAAEATPRELDALRRLLPALAEQFRVVRLEPLGAEAAVRVLELRAAALAQELRLSLDKALPRAVYRLFARFSPYAAFPGQAVGFLERLLRGSEGKSGALDPADALSLFIRETGLPALFLDDALTLARAEVDSALRRRVLGQDGACSAAAAVVTTFKAGLNDPKRPLGTLLFCGPTGVGKTELAKALSEYLFGHGERRERLVRLDMSEYSLPGSSARLFSDGAGEPSRLIRELRLKPFSVVLFDEIEKAAGDVFDALMGLLDEGRLTDRFGRTTDFHSALVILTSNLGAQAKDPVGFGSGSAPSYETEARAFFRLEFFNRIDAVISFAPLGSATVAEIAAKELKALSAREGLAKRKLKLSWSPALLARLAKDGWDPRYGARPLQRAMERIVVTPLARRLLAEPEIEDAELRLDLTGSGELTIEY